MEPPPATRSPTSAPSCCPKKAAGADVSVIEQLLPYAEPGAERWPDGSSELPMRWRGVAAATAVTVAVAFALLRRARRKR